MMDWILKLLRGEQFLKVFQTTRDDEDVCQAIEAFEQAAACLSVNDPRFGLTLDHIAAAYQERYKRFGRVDDLENAITRRAQAVALTPEEDAKYPRLLNNLGESLSRRFNHTGHLDDISEAIKLQQQAVQLTSEDRVRLPHFLWYLGISLSCRFRHTGDLEDISEAIRNQQRAVQLTPEGDVFLPGRLNSLGFSFFTRSGRTGDLNDVSEAIRNHQLAVQLTPDGHADLRGRIGNLGNSFSRRFDCTEDLEDLLEAIRNQRHALQLTMEVDPIMPVWLNSLGTSLVSLFERTGDLEHISDAIRKQQRAIQLTPDGHALLPVYHSNVGCSFARRFHHSGDLGDVAEAIRNLQRAVQLTAEEHANLPLSLYNLAHSFLSRFEHTQDSEDLSEAIQHQQRAIQHIPDGHAALPAHLSGLGTSFLYRFMCTGDREDLFNAMEHQQRAIQLIPEGHAQMERRELHHLAILFSSRFEHAGDLDDISEAIRIEQKVVQLLVQLTPDGHAELPSCLSTLGNLFWQRFEGTGDPQDISEAIRNQELAIQSTPDGHPQMPTRLNNLGRSFSSDFDCTGNHKSLSAAVLNYRLSATSSSGPLSVRLRAAKNWATLSRQSYSPSSEVLEAHACTINLLSLTSSLEDTIQRRHEILVDDSQLSLAASAAALSLGRPDKALEWLVEGRCIVWNQINQFRTPVDELRSHDPALAERLSVLSRRLESAGLRARSRGELSMNEKITAEDEARIHVKLAQDWAKLLETIRNIPRFRDFLQPRKSADIMCGLPEEGPIVIINIHSDRCDALALIADADEPLHIPLPNFSQQEAERLANGLRGYLHSFGVRSRFGVPLAVNGSDIDVDFPTVLKVLWSDVVSPILEGLAFPATPRSNTKLPRIWWCPTGPLAFLPIHAAGIYEQVKGIPGQCLSEFVVSSYIPTVNVRPGSNLKSVKNAPAGLLMVSQPNTPGKGEIPFTRDEIEKITKELDVRKIPSYPLDNENATVNHVLEAMEEFPCIHLACHASQHTETPLKSSIHLHDGPLELSEIMRKNLCNAEFAFLSACQTSRGDTKLPEEVVHLASGMLAAGYRSVVGTMWSVFDEHGPAVAEFFYNSLLDDPANEVLRIDGSRAARALHKATKRLRDKVSDSPYSFLAWVPYIHMGI